MTFKEKVFAVARSIPRGETLTYKQVATKAGKPCAYRAVGNILNTWIESVWKSKTLNSKQDIRIKLKASKTLWCALFRFFARYLDPHIAFLRICILHFDIS